MDVNPAWIVVAVLLVSNIALIARSTASRSEVDKLGAKIDKFDTKITEEIGGLRQDMQKGLSEHRKEFGEISTELWARLRAMELDHNGFKLEVTRSFRDYVTKDEVTRTMRVQGEVQVGHLQKMEALLEKLTTRS